MGLLEVKRVERSDGEDEKGDGVLEPEDDDKKEREEGEGNEMRMPCLPNVQSRYELASSKFVNKEIL